MTAARRAQPNTCEASAAQMLAVDRAVAELRRGGLVVVGGAADSVVTQAAEAVTAGSLTALGRFGQGNLGLALTGRRAVALSVATATSQSVVLPLNATADAATVRSLADPTRAAVHIRGTLTAVEAAKGAPGAAIKLLKFARLLPAALIAPLPADPQGRARKRRMLYVPAEAVEAYPRAVAAMLRPVAEARLPLEGAPDCRIVAFRSDYGDADQYAVVIGNLDGERPVLCRVHSACFTGDLLGSLRCDCGPQLRAAIRAMATEGSGVVLYLAQEGRGVGLVNKLRAYRLQDRGMDTVEANEQLGFEADERDYIAAATMLRHLGIARVRLMTDNPEKLDALARHGVEVAERVLLEVPPRAHDRCCPGEPDVASAGRLTSPTNGARPRSSPGRDSLWRVSMYSLTIRDYVKMAHTLKGDIFGPAQKLHLLTYEVETTYATDALDENNLIVDFGAAQQTLSSILSEMNFKNLDELPEFEDVNTTTEFLCAYIHRRIGEAMGDRFSGRLSVTLRESPVAWATYEGPVGA